MIPWRRLAETNVPGEAAPLVLSQRGDEFAIRVGAHLLMGSTMHGSEEQLAELACERLATRPAARVLVGGLGMGYTLAAALAHLGADAAVEVAELVPDVVEWNRGPLAHLAGRPLDDPRVTVWTGDVGERIRAARARYDAIVLDVDNGPDGLTRASNRALYSRAGIAAAHAALRGRGVLGVWSVAPDDAFAGRFEHAGFRVEERRVRARRTKGWRHVLWGGERQVP